MLFGKVLSVEVGRIYTKIVDLTVQNGKYTVGKSAVIPTPDGAYDDGYIKEDEALCDALFAAIHKYNMTKRRVAFNISSSKIINREIVLPYVSNNKILPMINANASDYFPVDISKYKVTWQVMERFTEEKVKKMKLMVIAVPMDLLESYYQFAQDIGMSVEIIDYSGNSIYQLVKGVSKEDAIMSVHIGQTNTMVSIVNKGVLELQRLVPYGVMSVLENVAMRNDQYPNGVDDNELLDRLRKEELINSVLPDEADDYDPDMDETARLRQDVTESFRAMLDRIGRVIHYYGAVRPDMKLGRLVVTGTGATLKGINGLLQFELGMAVSGMNVIKNVRMDPKLKKKEDKEKRTAFEVLEDDAALDLCEVALCIGAAIGPMNLLSSDLQGKKQKRQSLTAAVTCFVLGLLVSGAMAGFAYISLASANMTKSNLEKQITELSAIDDVLQEHDEITLVYDSVLQMYDSTRNPNENLVAFIEELEEKMPSSIEVLTCSITSSGVSLSIEVADWVSAADAIAQLKTFETLSSISVSAVTEAERTVEVDNQTNIGEDGVESDSNSGSVLVNKETEVQTYCTFSATCVWANIDSAYTSADEADVENEAETEETESEEGES